MQQTRRNRLAHDKYSIHSKWFLKYNMDRANLEVLSLFKTPFWREEDWNKMIENLKLKPNYHECMMYTWLYEWKIKKKRRSGCLGRCKMASGTPQERSWVRGDFLQPSSRSSSPRRQEMALGFLSLRWKIALDLISEWNGWEWFLSAQWVINLS